MSVHERWNKVLKELPAIGKNRVNQQQGFKFRGVDDVLDKVHPLFGKHGVHVIPTRQASERSQRTTKSGGVIHVVNMTVDWRIWGIEGDSFDAQTEGEGTDSGDKATSKAQTMAFKYLLWPALAVAENEETDADGQTPEDTTAVRDAPTPKQLGMIRGLMDELGMSAEDARTDACKVADREVLHLSDLTKSEASKLIDLWKAA